MLVYIFRRAGLGVLVLLLAISSLYVLIQAAPGDPASAMLGPRATPEMKPAIAERLGLDKPMPVQVFNYLTSVLGGDLGTDLRSRQPVVDTLAIHLPRTLELLAASLFVAAALGIPLGCIAAVRRNSRFDRLIGILSVSVIAVPAVILAIFGMLIFAAGLGWVPAIGAGEDEGLLGKLHHLILPAFAVGIGWVGYLARLVRASMIEVLSTNYIRNARAFGLPKRRIIYRYALRIAIAPTITVIGIGVMMGSAVFVEIVFARPGIGKLMYEAVILRNYPVSLGAVLAASTILVVATTLSDILNAIIDPPVHGDRRMSALDTAPTKRSNAFLSGLGRLMRDPMGAVGVVLVTLLVLSAVFAAVLAPFDPAAIDVPNKLQPPSATHLLGTDQLGRDVLSRALYGGQIALTVALVSTALSVGIGVALGMLAGFGPRWLDNLIVLSFDTVRAYPVIILALAVGPIFGAGLKTVIGILVVTSVPYYGRIVRTSVIAASKADYVEVLQAMGMRRVRIVVRHILPNIIGPILILASMDIPVYIAAEAGLSFLGVGVKPPQSSWGLILDDGYKFIRQTYWLVIAGAAPLIIATLGFTFLGEALRDTFDPKLRRGA